MSIKVRAAGFVASSVVVLIQASAPATPVYLSQERWVRATARVTGEGGTKTESAGDFGPFDKRVDEGHSITRYELSYDRQYHTEREWAIAYAIQRSALGDAGIELWADGDHWNEQSTLWLRSDRFSYSETFLSVTFRLDSPHTWEMSAEPMHGFLMYGVQEFGLFESAADVPVTDPILAPGKYRFIHHYGFPGGFMPNSSRSTVTASLRLNEVPEPGVAGLAIACWAGVIRRKSRFRLGMGRVDTPR